MDEDFADNYCQKVIFWQNITSNLRIIHLQESVPTIVEASADLLPRAELRAIFAHLKSRATILISVFFFSFIFGYPMAEWMIEILLDADGIDRLALRWK